ncbi:NAD(P)/FAD-dependent oxidoreductase [Desulfomarina sp.]
MNKILQTGHCDVAIIGGGPAGISAAITLKKSGLDRIIILERESMAGGIPRHCGHPPFGIREYKRILTGPAYAEKIVDDSLAKGIEIALRTTVISIGPEGLLSIVCPEGAVELKARRVLIATGARETPRSARFVSGGRPLGIYNTGALQSMVYLKNTIPFRKPIIIGTEIVSFSALFTCKKSGIRPVAMVEENVRPTVKWPIPLAARFFNVPLHLNTKVTRIIGHDRVSAVRIEDMKGSAEEISCDGILFTGKFVPESSLARMGHLNIEPATGIPVTDKYGRCSDRSYYAAGNIAHHKAEVAGKCWQAGKTVAMNIYRDLAGQLI